MEETGQKKQSESIMPYREILERIARAIAKNHGFDYTGSDMLAIQSPRAYLYTSDAEVALEVIDQYLGEHEIGFADLKVPRDNVTPVTPTSASQSDQVFPTWEQLTEWVEKLYKFWNCDASDRFLCEQYELDRKEALRAYLNPEELSAFYDHLTTRAKHLHETTSRGDIDKLTLCIVRMLNPYPNKIEVKLYFNDEMICVGGKCCDHWATSHGGRYTREINCVIPTGLNPILMSLTEILQHGKDASIEVWQAPQVEPEKPKNATKTKPTEQSRIELYKNGKLLEVQLYFDSGDICLGVHGKNFLISYKGMFAYSWAGYIKTGFNPIGKHIEAIGADGTHKTLRPEKRPQHTHYKSLTKSERELLNCFVGREIEFERFRVIKRHLLEVEGFKVGGLISSQSDCKGWFVTAGKDKAALFWTPSNGWQIEPRHNQTELTGAFEGYDLIEALEANNIEVNGVSANDWNNARDEEAEAEAVALQMKEAKKTTKKQPVLDIPWVDLQK